MQSKPKEKDLCKKMPRNIRKPLMERRRRQKINDSIDSLKSLLIELVPQSKNNDKWEKADILEMTVNYMKTLQPKSARVPESANIPRQEASCSRSSSESLSPYNSESTRNSLTPGFVNLANISRQEASCSRSSSESLSPYNSESTRNSLTPGFVNLANISRQEASCSRSSSESLSPYNSESTRNSEISSLSSPEEDRVEMSHCFTCNQESNSTRNSNTSRFSSHEMVRNANYFRPNNIHQIGPWSTSNMKTLNHLKPEGARNVNNFVMSYSNMYNLGELRPVNLETSNSARLEEDHQVHNEVNNLLWRPF